MEQPQFPREGKHLDEAVLLRAISVLKDELINIINTGITRVQVSVSTLQAQQNEHMLLQERRNSTFASRERVEALANQVTSNTDGITNLLRNHNDSTEDLQEIRTIITTAERAQSKSRIENLTKGYAAIGAGLIAIAGVLAQFFFHFWNK